MDEIHAKRGILTGIPFIPRYIELILLASVGIGLSVFMKSVAWQPWAVLGLGLMLTGLMTAYIRQILKHSDYMRIFANEQLEIMRELADEIAERTQAEQELQQRTNYLGERVKGINGLYNISKLTQKPEIVLRDMLQETTGLIPPAFQYPDRTHARIIFENQEFKTDNFTETPWGLTSAIMVYGERAGAIEVYVNREASVANESSFPEEENEFLREVATQVGRVIERKRAQEELWLFNSMMDQSNEALYVVDAETGRFLAANEKACASLGYEWTELLKMRIIDVEEIFPDDEAWAEHVRVVRYQGPAVIEGVHKRKDGSTFPTEVGIKYVKSENRGYIVATGRDITERKKVQNELNFQKECALTESEKLRKALEQLRSLLKEAERSQSFDVRFENPFMGNCWEIKNCDYKECPCYGQRNVRCWQITGTHCGGEIHCLCAQKIRNCEECEVLRMAAADPILEIGETFNNLMSILENKHKDLLEANTTLGEMNERLKANQNQLVQSEKMASIGQLAAGVAHEINNPVGFVKSNLGTLTGYVKTFKAIFEEYRGLSGAIHNDDKIVQTAILDNVEKISEKEDLPYILEDIDNLLTESIEGTERVRDIVQNLKSFARIDETQVKEADINEGIEATLKIVWNELKYKCTVHRNLQPLPLIRCCPGQLNQVFMNMLVNAAQAIPEKGDITIETEATDKDIIIRISDTGVGIKQENISKLFDPFFTTKAAGKGTGLGLSISIGIIQKHNGTIYVESEAGKGSTFTIHLPIEGVRDNG